MDFDSLKTNKRSPKILQTIKFKSNEETIAVSSILGRDVTDLGWLRGLQKMLLCPSQCSLMGGAYEPKHEEPMAAVTIPHHLT